MSSESNGPVADILVVDDTPANLQLLSGMLKERGYRVRPAPSGTLALQAARSEVPDLILLDINMPDLSGYDVAREIKSDERLRDIPIIFISALNETDDKVRAFEAGGVDYVTKPFQFAEVQARVSTHLSLARLQAERARRTKELLRANDELRRLQDLRDNLLHMLVHDLRSPLMTLVINIEMLAENDGEDLTLKSAQIATRARTAARRMVEMVNSLLDVGRMEASQLELHRTDCDLVALARDVFDEFEAVRGKRTFELEAPDPSLIIHADRELIARVLHNLVGNAVKYLPQTGSLRVTVRRDDESIRVSVIDDGPGIPADQHERIFEKFGQVKKSGPRVGSGLGLAFCKLAVEAHGGRIGVESQVGQGSTFWFEIPA